MALYTKSIQKKRTVKDGIRICIMRRPDKDADFDIWMPTLAPSNDLLTSYHQKKIDWSAYVKLFSDEVLAKNKKYLLLLIHLAKKFPITILCWEKTPEFCHRRLVAGACRKIDPTLLILIR